METTCSKASHLDVLASTPTRLESVRVHVLVEFLHPHLSVIAHVTISAQLVNYCIVCFDWAATNVASAACCPGKVRILSG